jgi:hypothetical protein
MSYHYLRPKPDHDPEPNDYILCVGQSQRFGTVVVVRVSLSLYVAECSFCGWRKKYPTQSSNGVAWDTFCHNRRRLKEGCPTNPTREEGF